MVCCLSDGGYCVSRPDVGNHIISKTTREKEGIHRVGLGRPGQA